MSDKPDDAPDEPISLEGDDEPITLDGDEKPAPTAVRKPDDDEPIRLVDSEPSEQAPATRRVHGGGISTTQKVDQFKRPLNATGQGATRCRVFHSKVALSSLQYMENQINEWLDADDIEIKHVGHVIGTMEGKIAEPNLVVMVWY